MKKNKQIVESYKKRLMIGITKNSPINEAARYMMPEPTMDPSGGGILGRLARGLSRVSRGGPITRNYMWRHPETGENFFGVPPSLFDDLFGRGWNMDDVLHGLFRDSNGNYFVRIPGSDPPRLQQFQFDQGQWQPIGKPTFAPGHGSGGSGLQHWNPSTGNYGGPGVVGGWLMWENTPGLGAPETNPDEFLPDLPPDAMDDDNNYRA